ncbi:MAG: TlpA family protein disulfide reductase [Candidatus Acidifodinimicrobium sp.]
MKIKVKYVLYAFVILIALYLVLNFLFLNKPKYTEFLSVGNVAPNYTFQLANGSIENVDSYRGEPLLLWFVATWCSSCAQGNSVLANNLAFFKSHDIKIVELEQYDDLGYSGMPISQFISEYGNNTYVRGGTAGYNMTLAYNTPPSLQLDIYYLIGPDGRILYIGEGLATGINSLENFIAKEAL